eukprot:11564828-Prorocentrum_lima.AAC.1
MPGQLLEVIGSVYGFVDSPRKWHISFRTRMGGAKGRLISLLVLHVGDVLVTAGGEGADDAIDQ